MNGTATEALMPATAHTLWWIGLAITLLVFVPLSVYLLHRTFVAACSIRRNADEALAAAAGIAGNTRHIPALDSTIGVAGAMVGVAGEISTKLDLAANVIAQRAT